MKILVPELAITNTAYNTLIFHLQIETPISYKTHQMDVISIPPQKRKKLKKKSFIYRISSHSFEFPAVLFLVVPAWNSN